MYASELMELARKNQQEYEGRRYKVVEGTSGMWNNATMKRYTECVIDEGKLYSDGYPMMIFDDTILEEIPPKPKPVTFLEAAKAFDDRVSAVECTCNGYTHTYTNRADGFVDENGNAVTTREILSGVWRICK